MRSLLAILLLLSGYGNLKAQDLTGQWTGTATDGKSDKKQKLVLSITEGDSAFGGVLHWYSPETQYIRHIIVSGRFYGKDSILTIREDSAINSVVDGRPGGESGAERAARESVAGKVESESVAGRVESEFAVGKGPAAGFYILFYRRTAGRKDLLEGHWGFGDPRTGEAGELEIRLEKKAPPFIPLLSPSRPKKDSAQSKQFQVLRDRQSTVAASIPVKGTDTIRIELYDNGEIDGDSVSLFVNNQLLVQHLKLTAQAKVLLVPIDKNLPVNTLVLLAENLGKLPPNTALMEVTVHGKTYNLFLSTDYKRNASVEFKLQE